MSETIDDGAAYRVTLNKMILMGRARIHPGPGVLLRGDQLKRLLTENAAAIATYVLKR